MPLSKSLYIRGLQCEKSLWLKKEKPEVLQAPDDSAQAVFDTGTSVGELACELFSSGERIEFSGDFDAQIAKTKELIKRGTKVIYEATFCFDGILVMVDPSHRRGWAYHQRSKEFDFRKRRIYRRCGHSVLRH